MQEPLGRRYSIIFARFDNGLDVDDGSAVDCLQILHLKPAVPLDLENLYTVQTYRIRPVRRTSCKHARQRVPHITSRVHLENGALRFMQPRENPNLLTRLD